MRMKLCSNNIDQRTFLKPVYVCKLFHTRLDDTRLKFQTCNLSEFGICTHRDLFIVELDMCNLCRRIWNDLSVRPQQSHSVYESGTPTVIFVTLFYFRLIAYLQSADILDYKYLKGNVEGGGHEIRFAETNITGTSPARSCLISQCAFQYRFTKIRRGSYAKLKWRKVDLQIPFLEEMRHNWSVTQRLCQKRMFWNSHMPRPKTWALLIHFSSLIRRHPQLRLRNAESRSIMTEAAYSRVGIHQSAGVNTA